MLQLAESILARSSFGLLARATLIVAMGLLAAAVVVDVVDQWP